MKLKKLSVSVCTLLLAICCNMSHAKTLYVDSAVTVSGNGSSWQQAFKLLGNALDKAHKDYSIDTILVAQGTYFPNHYAYDMGINRVGTELNGKHLFNQTFHIRIGLKVIGGFNATTGTRNVSKNPSILSGVNDTNYNCFHVVLMDSSNNWITPGSFSELNGFTITKGGNGQIGSGSFIVNNQHVERASGAGLYAHYASVRIIDNTFYDNNANIAGGGISFANCNATLKNNVVDYNSAGKGGGISCINSNLIALHTTIKRNGSSQAAALFIAGGHVRLKNADITNNLSNSNKTGSIHAANAKVEVDSSLIEKDHRLFYAYSSQIVIDNSNLENALVYGYRSNNSIATIKNSLLYKNQYAIYLDAGNHTFLNCTLDSNTYGIYRFGGILKVQGCFFKRCPKSIIEELFDLSGERPYFDVQNNTFFDSTRISLYGTSRTRSSLFAHNKVVQSGRTSLSANLLEAHHNTINKGSLGFSELEFGGNINVYNNIIDSGRIEFAQQRGPTIRGVCRIYNNIITNSPYESALYTLQNCYIYNNIIIKSKQRALHSANNFNGRIFNNVFAFNNQSRSGVHIVYVHDRSDSINFENNILYKNNTVFGYKEFRFESSDIVNIRNNSFEQPRDSFNFLPKYVYSNNLFDSKPLFVDEHNAFGSDSIVGTLDDGFQLKAESPLINAGSNITSHLASTDFQNQARIQDTFTDIGPYEGKGICVDKYDSFEYITCISYKAHNGKDTWKHNGIFKDTFTNTFGCLEIHTVNLKIQPKEVFITNLDTQYCLRDQSFYLKSEPEGGVFKINQQEGILFDPDTLGVGIHEVVYSLMSLQDSCIDSTVHLVRIINCHTSLTKPGLEKFTLTPNPSHGSFLIHGNNDIQNIEVFDNLGALRKRISSIGNHQLPYVLDLKSFEPGVFYIQLRTSANTTILLKAIKV